MRVTTSKSKISESFYITQSYTNAQGKSTSKTIRKLGPLAELSERLHTDRDGIMAWANEQARFETADTKAKRKMLLSWFLLVLAGKMNFIQAEVYKNSFFLGSRNDRILYYDCTNYYLENFGLSNIRISYNVFLVV